MGNKKFDLKSMLVGLIVGAGLFGGVVGASTLVAGNVYLSPFPIVANGKSYTATLPILNYTGSTYVPLKELATLTGTEVKFQNNTIYIDNKKETTTVTKPVYTTSQIEIEKGDKTTIPVNLSKYNATTATASVSDSCIKLSQSVFTASGNLTVTGQTEGKATLTIKYNTGAIDYVSVTVEAEEDEEEIEVEVDDYENVYIDLDDYDADKATISITSGSSYVTLNKTTFTSSGNLKITGKKEGEATIKVKYDTDDVAYIYVEVTDNSDSDDEDLEIEVDDYENVYIDLDDYDADKATISITSGSSYVTLNKTTFTSSGNLKITGKKEGKATIRIKFDSDDTEYLYVEVVDEDDDYDYEDEFLIDVDEDEYIYVDLEDYDADEADISIVSGKSYISLGRTSTTSSRNVKVTGEKEGKAIVKVAYDTGDTEYYLFEVYGDEDDEADYDDYDYEDEFFMDINEEEYIYVDLESYDADEADLRVIAGKSYITVSRINTTTSRDIKVTAKEEGEAIVEVEYDTGDVEYYWFEITD